MATADAPNKAWPVGVCDTVYEKERIMTQPIPEPFHTVTPHLVIRGAADAIDFYKQAFGAQEIMRMRGPDGQSHHQEISGGLLEVRNNIATVLTAVLQPA